MLFVLVLFEPIPLTVYLGIYLYARTRGQDPGIKLLSI